MPMNHEIITALADGRFHSGTEIGMRLGVSRAAVCKRIKRLCQEGMDIDRIPGRGYRMVSPVQVIDQSRIRQYLAERVPGFAAELTVLQEVDSTSRYLLQQTVAGVIRGSVCLAEAQTQGRGRGGRSWVATPYQNILLSMVWRFDTGPATLGGLSLAAGVAVAGALREYGARAVGLKWPNDVLWRERKLAGLLVDIRGEAAGPCTVIVGVGVNMRIAPADGHRIDQPWVDLSTVVRSRPDRNRAAGILIGHLWGMFRTFEQHGLPAFQDAWERLHVHAGRRVRLSTPEGVVWGKALGTDTSGALLLLDDQGHTRRYLCGDVSLRTVP